MIHGFLKRTAMARTHNQPYQHTSIQVSKHRSEIKLRKEKEESRKARQEAVHDHHHNHSAKRNDQDGLMARICKESRDLG